jgi:hypothetical protein
VGQHAVERGLDAVREVVERPARGGAHHDVQAHAEDALVAASQAVPQPLGVFERDLALGVGDPLFPKLR